MNISDFKENGKLELYVAGVLPEHEMIAITKVVKENPEVLAEVEQLESAFIKYASLYGSAISAATKDSIINQQKAATPPTDNTSFFNSKAFCMLGWSLLIVSLVCNYIQYNNSKTNVEAVQELEKQEQIFAEDLDKLNEKYQLTQKQFAKVRDPNTERIVLASTRKIPSEEAIIYWDGESEEVYVDISALPAPPEGSVYQLWWMDSLDPLSPNSAGTLDNYNENDQKIFNASTQKGALAFAITLEPAGGNESPTLDQLFVLGTT